MDTGSNGHHFVKLNTGMDAITRPSLYGARHPIIVVPSVRILYRTTAASILISSIQDEERRKIPFAERPVQEYIVVGHCCETGDMLTQSLGGAFEKRTLHKAEIGDVVVIEGAGAYCSAMCTKNYNSFPELEELLLKSDGEFVVIRKRQTLEQMIQNEVTE